MKFAKLLIFLSACALLAGCSKSSNTNNTGATASNTTSTTTTTTTASPKATAEATKSPAEAASSGSKVSKPEDAAQGLFNAWKTKDRTTAAKFATNEAITSLYSEGGPEGLQFQGCDKQGEGYLCGYSYEGGGLMMVVEGSDSTGYKVTGTSFIAD
ncbi:MAG: hypothetical protein QOH25_1704 [Acidobacteriota bacterium]|jgi:hypothetical protein|nr:hypothetical protein [Acidobacteriota bacterium]